MIRRGESWVPTREGNIVAADVAGLKVGYADAARVVGSRGVDSYTKSLLHFEGANNSVAFQDDTGKVWTPNGDAKISTTAPARGLASGYFDGNGDYLTTPDHADFAFGSNNFTMEFCINNDAGSSNCAIFDYEQDSDNYVRASVDPSLLGGKFLFAAAVGGVTKANYFGAPLFTAGVWSHIAFVRSGTSVYLFKDSATIALTTVTAISTNSLITSAANAIIGAEYHAGAYDGHLFKGYLDEFRLSIGIARWTAAGFALGDAYGGT